MNPSGFCGENRLWGVRNEGGGSLGDHNIPGERWLWLDLEGKW